MNILKKEGRHDSAHDIERVAEVTTKFFVYRQDLWTRMARTIKSQVTITQPLPIITIFLFNYLDMQRRRPARLNNPTEDRRHSTATLFLLWNVDGLVIAESLPIEPEVLLLRLCLLLFCEPLLRGCRGRRMLGVHGNIGYDAVPCNPKQQQISRSRNRARSSTKEPGRTRSQSTLPPHQPQESSTSSITIISLIHLPPSLPILFTLQPST